MKTILFLFFPFILFSQTSQYNNGYYKGYKNGYCRALGYDCAAPAAPYPKYSQRQSFSDGYDDGFLAGIERYNENNKSSETTSNNYNNLNDSYKDLYEAEEGLKSENIILISKIKNTLKSYEIAIQSCMKYLSDNKMESDNFTAIINRFITKHNKAVNLLNSRSSATEISTELAEDIYSVVTDLKEDMEYTARYGDFKGIFFPK